MFRYRHTKKIDGYQWLYRKFSNYCENEFGIGLTIASTTNGYVAWSRVTSRWSATHTSLHDIECRKGKKCCKENFHVRMKTKVEVVILRKYL